MLRPGPVSVDSRHCQIRVHVAGARAVAQLADVVLDIRVPDLAVWPGSVVVGVTTGAIGLIGRGRPVHDFRIALMTGGIRAIEINAVIQGLVRQRRVLEIVRQPGHRVVAGAALLCGDEVPVVLAGRDGTVVAGRTRSEHLRVIDHVDRREEHRVMACLTYIGGLRMRRVLAGRIRAVVAIDAVPDDIKVIEIRRDKGHSGMAIVTVVAARDVCWILANRDHIVMARDAGADNLGVINGVNRGPDHVVVAVLTHIRAQYMCRDLAGRLGAIVAADAVTDDVDVIEVRRNEGHCRMTVVTVIATANMRWILAYRDRVVMARDAGTDDLGVIDSVHRGKDNVVVAVLAHCGALYMCRGLADRIHTVVTTDAVTNDVDVVEIRRYPCD